MTRITSALSSRNDTALIAFVTVGYPTPEATLEAVLLLESCGVDMVELGIPFSDPLADGITIQHASHRALQNGVTPSACLDLACRIRQKSNMPLLFMTYYNPVLAYGPGLFCADSSRAGIDGLIIPDLPLEESGALEESTSRHNLDLIYLLTPNCQQGRIKLVAERARGFIYLVSLTGVTGMRQELPPGLDSFAARVRSYTPKPLCVGFGISTPQQAAEAAASVDGVIVGSSIVQIMGSRKDWRPLLAEFVTSLKKALVGKATGE